MTGFALRTILFLTGLFLLLIILTIGIRRRSTGWIVFSSVGLFLIVISVWMGSWKAYQCKYTMPDEIRIAGRITDGSNSYPNDFLVLLYRDNVEMANSVTHTGIFEGEREEQKSGGHFEFAIPNQDQLTRCSMIANFKQNSSGRDFLWINNKKTYLWNNYSDLMPGVHFPINLNEGKKIYTLLVLPKSITNYPKDEINSFHTYLLDPDGNIAVNIPIKLYTMSGNTAVLTQTGYFAQPPISSTTAPGITYPVSSEVRDAWVIDDSTMEVKGDDIAEEIVDVENCTGATTKYQTETRSRIYYHEIQFLWNTYMPYDLGQVASKAANSLGFVQGQIDRQDAPVNGQADPGKHMKYRLIWYDIWRKGEIRVDSGLSNSPLQFRKRIGLGWRVEPYPVDCPQH